MESKNNLLDKIPIYLIIIIFIGLVIRVYNLGKFGFWFDEATYFVSLRHLATDPFGIFFIIVLKVLKTLTSSDWFLRFFSVMCGIFSIIMIYRFGELIFSKRIGILSALLLSISPLHIYYSQEFTSYSLSVFLALASSYYFIKFLKNSSFLTAFLYAISTLCFIYNHSINLILILIQNIIFLLFYQKDKFLLKKWLRLQLGIFFIYLPWLILTIIRAVTLSQLNLFFWLPKPELNEILQTFMVFSLGYHASWKTQLVALVIFIYLFLSAVFYWHKKKELSYLIFWLFLPMIFIWLISQRYHFYLHRIFIFSLPAFYLLAAAGLRDVKRHLNPGILMFCFVLITLSLKNYYENKLSPDYEKRYRGVHPKRDYKNAATYIADKFQEGDVILHISRSSFIPFLYYHNKKLSEYGMELNNVYEKDWVMVNEKMCSIYASNGILKPLKIEKEEDLLKYKRIWLIHSAWDPEGNSFLSSDNTGKQIVNWFNKNFSVKEMQVFDGICIYLFLPGK